jgi:TonB family protein
MSRVFIVLLLAVSVGWAQAESDACCKCENRASSGRSSEVICLSTKQIHDQVDHIEPLRPSGLGKDLNLRGTVVVEVRFDLDGKVECFRAKSGHPIAISAAVEAIPKWTFKPLLSNGVPRAGCGRITIKYRLRDHGSSTEIQ